MQKCWASAILCVSAAMSAPVYSLGDEALSAVKPLSAAYPSTPAITIQELNTPGSANWNGFFLVHDSQLTNQQQTPDAFLNGSDDKETQDHSEFTILSVPVPEPTGIVLMIIGGLGMLRKRK